MTQCLHRTIYPGSGGYYLFCKECGCAWIAWKMGCDERVTGVMEGQPAVGCVMFDDRVKIDH